jgi:hypothetical protein
MERFKSTIIGIALLGTVSVGGVLLVHHSATLKHLVDWRVGATFPSAKIADALKRMCSKEYHMTVEARHAGNTLQVFFWRIGLLKPDQVEMRPEAAESLEGVLLCATRIALSTDAHLQFIEVKMADVLTGSTVTLLRYVPDIRDSMYDRMAEDEYINRLVIEVNTQGSRSVLGQTPQWDEPVTMSEFLAKQVVLRAKRESPVGLQVHEDLSEPSMLVVVIDNWSSIAQQGDQQKQKVTDLLQKSVNTVLNGYRFVGFRGVVLEDGRGAALRTWKP